MSKSPDMKKALEIAFKKKPDEAIEYLMQKESTITTDWRELWEDAHARAFTISKMTDAQLLSDTQTLLTKSLKEGWSSTQTQTELTNLFKDKGWWGKKVIKDENGNEKEIQLGSPHRVRTIYKQNIQSAYNAQRYIKQLEDVDFAPYWEYVAILDERTRDSHRAMHGKVFRYDDEIWSSMYPPNGWGCRCMVKNLTEAEVNGKGLKIEKSGDNFKKRDVVINDETGETKEIGVYTTRDLRGKVIEMKTDAGWSSNVGKAAWDLDVLAYKTIQQLPDSLQDKFISQMAENTHNLKMVEWLIDRTLKHKNYGGYGVERTLTWFTPTVINYLKKNNIKLQYPAVIFHDGLVKHSLITKEKVPEQMLTLDQFKKLPKWIIEYDEVFYDTKDPAIVYVKFLPKDEIIDNRNCVKIPVIINNLNDNEHRPINYIGTSGRINYERTFTGENCPYKKIE